MEVMKKEIRSRKHLICEKLPLVAMVLASLAATVFMLVPELIVPKTVGPYVSSLMAVIILSAMGRWFAPEFKGVLKAGVPAKEVCMIFALFAADLVLSYLADLPDAGFYFNPTAAALASAVSAGFVEETMFRSVSVPIGMRYLKSEKRIIIIALLTSVLFGAVHLGNVNEGASMTMAVIQTVASIGGGLFYCAAYMRTGSALVPIVMHSVYDYMCFVTDPSLDNGIMTGESVTTGLVLSIAVKIAFGIVGLWLIRPAVRGKIQDIWDDKWSYSR